MLLLILLLGLVGPIVQAEPLQNPEVLANSQELQEDGFQVEQTEAKDSGNACLLDPSFSKECDKPKELFYYDQRANTCKSQIMCPPEKFGNAFATEDYCENLCMKNGDEQEVEEEGEEDVEESGAPLEDGSNTNPLASRTIYRPWNPYQNAQLNLDMVATSSSQFSSNNYPSRAVDKIIASDWNRMFHSGTGDSYPWLLVDMGHVNIVHKILAHLRTARSDRFNNVEARVGNYRWTQKRTRITANTYCSCPSDIIPRGVPTREFICSRPITGRFLSLQIITPARHDLFLEVNEIEVYGAYSNGGNPQENLLNLNMVATSSSQYSPSNYPSRAVDKIITSDWNKMFYSGTGDSYPWLFVDMGRVNIVHKILVYLRTARSERFNNVEARVGNYRWTQKRTRITKNSYCDYYYIAIQGNGVTSQEFVCSRPIRGRFLSLQIVEPARHDLFLEVNEIEVYGAYSSTSYPQGFHRVRSDGKCGHQYRLPDGTPSECNPHGAKPCCSNYGYCGLGTAFCDCGSCKDYRL